MRQIPLYDYAALPAPEHTRLAALVDGQRTLADVLTWARQQTPPAPIAEIVTQDEYTHDVVLPLGPAQYLAYDTT